ncbi:MAG: nitrate reductase subunit alpha [Candidatus Marinimicrobia bacterium]|jgi:nitrate reductase / nitrite oxidoreductase, alpha subunit|nr:nitrate reductase subunit alpha [Candidatus Neomarinimicrobiota bacterium]MBT3937828.1 nitrate reductase subunit alpha [Candidatus Neomarinimicrobiota bacterium]MBT3960796.1 nitrate reductase subunit alpha [Candidatus Neomarinimicrobiota bacterium]MBT4383185.1 nitrate reductase subunit alpha [Candidatus Neomarinimicrobiota bacterium]MBT4636022.1 nitrate reductase subunit alpha [Candidatus Neomarinimicrobiota bacterium]
MSNSKLSWIRDEVAPENRSWEEFYRNRWQYDKVVRSTHGVNCTGSCTWQIHVKDGIVTWEMQGLDYPKLEHGIPPYEPRGCQRGISFSWYLYSPLRVKYPTIRGALLDLWLDAKKEYDDPVEAWTSMVNDPEKRKRWQRARGKGGFRRADWETVKEIIAASMAHTIKQHGPDRIAGFSPIPAMSMISYASGARLMQLIGGVSLSFYDWYCDLPNASPETWGEQTDVQESADWYNAKMLAVMGANLNMTRTPDVHFAAEARHNGTKMVVFSPDFSQVSKFSDEWIPINAGQDGAYWMAVNHVILKEYHHEKQEKSFLDYSKQYTDSPFLVELSNESGSYKAGQLLRANRLSSYKNIENGDWQFLMWDEDENCTKVPQGSVGHRWANEEKGKWNLKLEDAVNGSKINPKLTFLNESDDIFNVELDDFSEGETITRGVPVKYIETENGKIPVATVYDLLMAQYGVGRGLEGYPTNYEDDSNFTPAWAEKYTGISPDTLIRFAREWANTAEKTGGKCTVIIGAGINHWYHANLMYRAAIHALMFTGCIGKNGGGLAHYVGQEKLAPGESWASIALAKDWFGPSRLQNTPSWHYVHSDQWRYEKSFTDYHTVPENQPEKTLAKGHTIDVNVKAVRNGWLPFYPQFESNPIDLAKEARTNGAHDEQGIVDYVVDKLKKRDMKFSIEDPDNSDNWPRVWFVWRGNAIGGSAKGHEFFLDHYLGTHTNQVSDPGFAKGSTEEVVWHDKVPQGKMDLVVDLNFRMDTSALYSDIVLPAATWYEKADLNSTDMHSFIHPLAEAVPPAWESKSDWDIFKDIAESFSKVSEKHFPEDMEDIVTLALAHDTPAEIAQKEIKDWIDGEIEAIPGKTMPGIKVVKRDYKNIYKKYISYGPNVPKNGLSAHGTHYHVKDEYDRLKVEFPTETWGGETYPSLKESKDVCNTVLQLATVTNGELAYRSYKNMEEKTGLVLADLGEKNRGVRMSYDDLCAQPRRLHNSPMWSGLLENGRAYSPFTYNVERLVPWRTLTGRQQFYLDHPGYIQYGEHLPTYKPKPTPTQYAELSTSESEHKAKVFNYLTPHGKWHIHSTYGDNHRMSTLSRGVEPFWINDKDAEELGIVDNDWVEVYNDNGVVVTRANVSVRIPRGIVIIYHATERTLSVPKSPLRGNKRAGMNNSLTRARLKPNLMVGGYGQFTYHFNYWGPTGANRDTFIMVRKLPILNW